MRRGHDVTLFASGDSQTLSRLEAVCLYAIRLDFNVKEYLVYEILELSQVYEQAAEFDIIHSHIGISALALAAVVKTPTVHTLYSCFTLDNRNLYNFHSKQPYISISNDQREVELNYLCTVYNGIETANYQFKAQPQEPRYAEMAAMIPAALELDRQTCRDYVEKNFSFTHMVNEGSIAVSGR